MNIQPSKQINRLPVQFFSTLVAKVNQYIEKGYDVINLGQGNPDLPTPPHIVRQMQQAVENPVHHRYPPFSGRMELKEAICKWYQNEQGVTLDPESEVAILFGAKTGLVELSQILLDPGDVALVPDPGYPDYQSGIAIAGGNMVPMPLLEKNQFLPNFEQITPEQRQRAKLMFLNYPGNPTGACASDDFFDDAIRFAEQHNIVIAHDFAYGAIGFDGKKPISYLTRPKAKQIGVEFYTLSKTYNMAGWRVGFALGNSQVIKFMEEIQDHYFVSLFGAVQEAATTALTSSQDCVDQLVQTYQSRRDVLFDEMEKMNWKAPRSQGSFFAWLPVPDGFTSQSFADYLLEEVQVVVAPGVGFGKSGEHYVRVGLLTDEQRIREAMQRIRSLGLFK